jgi:hypothetical protein
VDEFDRIDGYAHSDRFADLIKQLSDDLIQSTVVLVGVADDVSELLAGHGSIDRSLRQVAIPRMADSELREIVDSGFMAFSDRSGHTISVEPQASQAIARLAQGFPYYSHLLASSVGKEAIYSQRDSIAFEHVFQALLRATNEAEPSIRDSYHEATLAARSDATFRQTLLACALATPDHRGYFAASDVRGPLQGILAMPRRNSDFNAHLKRFAQEAPFILESQPVRNSQRYRFRNPLMRPFVLMRGLSSGHISPERFLGE